MHIKENLVLDMKNTLFWFRTNSLKANAGKLQIIILNWKNHRRQRMVIKTITVKESNEAILLGIRIDYKIIFKKHIGIYVGQLHALTRIRKYLNLYKAVLLGNTFINS